MGQNTSLRAWRGRWILTAVLLLLTIAGAVTALAKLPRTYQANASLVLLASRAASKPNGGNPYLSFNPSLTLTADVLSRELMAPGTASYLSSQGFSDSYTVTLATYTTQTTGSVLLVTVNGHDPDSVEATMIGVIDQISRRLAGLQNGIGASDRVRAQTLSMPANASLSVSQTARPLAVLAGLGLVISFCVPWVVDAQVQRGRGRRAGGAAPDTVSFLATDLVPAGSGKAAREAAAQGAGAREAAGERGPAGARPRSPASRAAAPAGRPGQGAARGGAADPQRDPQRRDGRPWPARSESGKLR